MSIFVLTLVAIPCRARICNVTSTGAKGDNRTNDGPAIQAAIDECSASGGGTAYVPAGDYRCGALRLRSDVTLFLDAGATLWVSPDKEDYADGNRFLYAEDQDNITIEGRGTIHGTGRDDLMRKRTDKTRQRPEFRVGILRLVRCRNVSIKDITVRYSDSWTFDLEFCENVLITGVNILNNYYRVNADGIDPVSCRNVHISNCHIVAGDDCIVFKTREGAPCEDAVVTNCTLESVATAIKIGTESASDFRNIHVSNCVIRNSTVGIGMYIKDGATAERISFTNCTIETIREPELVNSSIANSVYPIFVDIEKRHKDSRIGTVRDLTFANLNIVSDNGILVQGMSKGRIENLVLSNVNLRVNREFDYSARKKHVGGRTSETLDRRRTVYARKPSYATLANIKGLTVDGLRVFIPDAVFTRYERSALSLHGIDEATVSAISRSPAGAGSAMPVVVMENCRSAFLTECFALPGAFLTECFALPGTGVFLTVDGPNTANISLVGNDLSRAKVPVDPSAQVPQGQITQR
ncbi:MAG: glycoside hydrolase family 28 protein [Planctomycetota bacterium]